MTQVVDGMEQEERDERRKFYCILRSIVQIHRHKVLSMDSFLSSIRCSLFSFEYFCVALFE